MNFVSASHLLDVLHLISLPLITHCKYFLAFMKVIVAQFNIIITEWNTWSAC